MPGDPTDRNSELSIVDINWAHDWVSQTWVFNDFYIKSDLTDCFYDSNISFLFICVVNPAKPLTKFHGSRYKVSTIQ
jgi:hypothetical protein